MKILEVELSLEKSGVGLGDYYRGFGETWCEDALFSLLRRDYKLPETSPKHLWLSLHDRPAKDRLPLRAVRNRWGDRVLKRFSGRIYSDDWRVDYFLAEESIGKTVHLQIEYSE